MNRSQFLADLGVINFINWLCIQLPLIPVNFNIPHSPRVPGGLIAHVAGIENILRHYRWQSSWQNPSSPAPIKSVDWPTTRDSMVLLSNWIKAPATVNTNQIFLQACHEVLKWGGVLRGSKPFLAGLHASGDLVRYFVNNRVTLRLSHADIATPWPDITHFNSGLTKIHALLSSDGLPIYDSRVGAAIGGLVAMSKIQNPLLKFPSGGARGHQIRNAGIRWGTVYNQPQFHTSTVSHENWAKAAVKLGWIIEAVLTRCPNLFSGNNFFPAMPTIQKRMHAFEAALFMIGYDLSFL